LWKIDKGSRSGVTTGAYVNALDWNVQELGAKTILLKNTDAGASLKYRLLGYVAEDGISKELIAETSLEHAEVAEFHYDRQWHRLILQVIDGSGHAAYRIDYEGQGA
jgi:hypothetical protein